MLITDLTTNTVLHGVQADPITVAWDRKVRDLNGRKVLSREASPQTVEITLRSANGTNATLKELSTKTRDVKLKITLQESSDNGTPVDTWDINIVDAVPVSLTAGDDEWVLVLETISMPVYKKVAVK